MKVLKFGGTSVGNAAQILEAVECVKAAGKECAAVVVSALGGTTDLLVALSKRAGEGDEGYQDEFKLLESRHLETIEALIAPATRGRTIAWVKAALNELEEVLHGVSVIRECTAKTSDFILSFGERLSAFIFASTLNGQGQSAEYLDAREIIVTNESFGVAEADLDASTPLIRARIDAAKGMPIVTGFIAATLSGRTTTLGRGGSDLTAAIVGAALEVDEIEIWTDVDGIMTADPRLVPTAFPIARLTYEEAMELSHFGAKIIYPPTVQPALKKGIPIRIRNTMNPKFAGSVIGQGAENDMLVTGISSIANVALLRVQGLGMQGVTGTSKRVFSALADHGINVILITQASSEHTICFSVMPENSVEAKRAIEQEFGHEIARQLIDSVVVEENLSILSVVGEHMRHMPGLGGRLFQALGSNGINVAAIAQGSSELNISAVICADDRKKALNVVHDAFFLSDLRTGHLFVLGDGLIGSTLLKQIESGRAFLRERYHLTLQVNAIANTRFMAFSDDGIPVPKTQMLPAENRERACLNEFISRMMQMNLPHCVLVDCTASNAVPGLYKAALDNNISVVSPNKRGLAGPFSNYSELKSVERRRNVHFLYETCVGAGLPVIGTLNDLVRSGDEIYKAEAVLSGTLSFIFNSYSKGSSFAEIIRKAQALGLTEPDPREDLSGLDVGRKLLILAREIGYELDFEDVEVENLVPDSCAMGGVEDFYRQLAKEDRRFQDLLQEAEKIGGKLCYLASVSEGRARARLEIVRPDHPFHSLSGSDNIVAFTTRRYSQRPLVVKGPGAGPDVTAAGVLADIIRAVI